MTLSTDLVIRIVSLSMIISAEFTMYINVEHMVMGTSETFVFVRTFK